MVVRGYNHWAIWPAPMTEKVSGGHGFLSAPPGQYAPAGHMLQAGASVSRALGSSSKKPGTHWHSPTSFDPTGEVESA